MSDPATPVVASKIRPPPQLNNLVRRDKLVERLAAGFDDGASVGLVCAPAGFGKTTLLASYLHDSDARDAVGGHTAWFQVDNYDNEPLRFWTHLRAALDRPRLTNSVPFPQSWVRSGDWAAMVEQLVAGLDDGDSIRLVIDDYHDITTQSIHEHVDLLLRWLPRQVSIVIASRVDPPFREISRLRLQGRLVEIRAGDLTFDTNAGTRLLSSAAGVELAPKTAAGLVDRTEGWAAGLYLAGLSIKQHGDPETVMDRFDGNDRLMADYLRSEFLANLDDTWRRFLVHTSVLDELSGDICDYVSSGRGSALRLRELERSNLLLIPLDAVGGRYRHHHLIAQWLRNELVLTEPDLLPELHRRAAEWFIVAGEPERAYQHAVASGTGSLVVDVAERFWRVLLTSGRYVTLRSWLDGLGSIVESSAALCVARAQLARNTGEPVEVATSWLGRGAELADPTDVEVMVALHTNLMLHKRMIGDFSAAEQHGRQALSAVTDQTLVPEVRALLGATLAQTGQFAEAIDHLTAALATAPSASDQLTEVFALSQVTLPLYESGQRRRAKQTALDAMELTEGTSFADTPILGTARVVLGQLCLDDGRYGEAERHLEWAMTASKKSRSSTIRLHTLLALARHAMLTKHGVEARRLTSEAQHIVAEMPDPGRLESLVNAAQQRLDGPSPGSRSDPFFLVEDLTERELSVLRLLSSKLPLREIGSELYVSHNTVKGHAKTIYRKLGVHSRADAVDRAIDLGLL